MREWALLGACGGARRPDLEARPFRVLQIGNDCKQIAGGRIPVRAKHLVKGLYVHFSMRGQLGKADCGVDVIAQQFFAERNLARQKALDGIAKEALSKGRITFHVRLNRFPEISRQSHFHSSSFCCFFLCL